MAYNLSRNSRLFVTTNLSGTGAVNTSGFTTSNTWELQILDGFSFSQNTATTNVQINEAGETPIRGQRAFNTALNPVDLSFSTYMRPKSTGGQVTAEEKVLWNALLGSVEIGGGSVAIGDASAGLTRAGVSSAAFTITGSTLNTLTAGSTYNMTGLTGADAPLFNQPFKVVSSSSSALIGTYLTTPATTSDTTPTVDTDNVIFTQSAWVDQPTATGVTVPYGLCTSAHSNKNQLQRIGFIFKVDNSWYTTDNASLGQASVDFGLDAISTIAWTAQGTKLNEIAGVTIDANDAFGGTFSGTLTGKDTTAQYITNKLSSLTLKSTLGGVGSGAKSYTVALTGGNFTISNNINYITPQNLGVVNIPIGYYTGTRSVSGTVNAYLRTGTGYAADLLKDMLSSISTAAETKYKLQVEVGGINNATRVELDMAGVVLGIPSVDVQDVISTSITFNAQGTAKDLIGVTGAEYDLENTNDIAIRYFAVAG